MAYLLASMGILAAWIIYRLNIIDEKNKILNSLEAVLDYSGQWFNASYSEEKNNPGWFHPCKSVYKVDVSILNNIVNNNTVSKELSKLLSYFVQLVARFNHRVDLFNQFIHSDEYLLKEATKFYKENCFCDKDYDECKNIIENLKSEEDENLKFYIKKIYSLQKSIHTDGIGAQNYYSMEFPQLSLCYRKLREQLLIEGKNEIKLFCNKRYIFWDIIFIIIPASIILEKIFSILNNVDILIFLK